MKRKSIKLYTHHNTYHEYVREQGLFSGGVRRFLALFLESPVKVSYVTGLLLMHICYYTGVICIQSCYFAGLAIVYALTLPIKAAKRLRRGLAREMEATEHSLAQKFARLKTPQFAFAMVIFVTLAAGSMGFLKAGQLFAEGMHLKGKILGQTEQALEYFSGGQKALETQEVQLAQKEFARAYEAFQNSQDEMKKTGLLIDTISNIIPQKRDGNRLLEAGKYISSAALSMTNFYTQAKQLRVSTAGLDSGSGDYPFDNLQASLADGLKNISEARELINKIDLDHVPADKQEAFLEAKANVDGLEHTLTVFSDLFLLFSDLTSGSKEVLLLMQNNNELRATGGFIGTFGSFTLKNARIENLKVSSIYDLDGQLKEKIIPPYPLFNVNDRWYMRDSNWFADFPQSVEVLSGFYEKEGGETPDLVLALTPNIITDILTFTGPIEMKKYGVTLDADNFVEMTQVSTSVTYTKDENKPKQMLADFLPILLERTFALESKEMLPLLVALQKDFDGKHIMLYARDPDLEERLDSYNWSGRIRKTDRDYLSVVSSNLSGTKTDLTMKQEVTLTSSITDDGSIENTVAITRTNPLPAIDKMTNLSFIRVLVPEGSTLVESSGFSYVDLETKYQAEGEIHPSALDWEKNSVRDLVSGIMIGKEAGKTYFGNWAEVKGGESRTVKVTYRLPFKLKELDRLSLLVQKQPGAVNQKIRYELNPGMHSIVWKNFDAESGEAGVVTYEGNLDRDIFLGAVVKK